MEYLEFDSSTHSYTLEGTKIPSVSELLQPLHCYAYGQMTEQGQEAMRKAASRGTKVHKFCEDFDLGKEASIDESLVDYAKAYMVFLDEHEVEWKKVEHAGYSNWSGQLYGGTIDRFGILDSVPTLLDIKTTSSISKAKRIMYGTQMTFYEDILRRGGDEVAQLVILQLKKDGSYKIIKTDRYMNLANDCVDMYKTFKMRR